MAALRNKNIIAVLKVDEGKKEGWFLLKYDRFALSVCFHDWFGFRPDVKLFSKN